MIYPFPSPSSLVRFPFGASYLGPSLSMPISFTLCALRALKGGIIQLLTAPRLGDLSQQCRDARHVDETDSIEILS